jgi:TolB-like protein/class 3 adenylate cyclase
MQSGNRDRVERRLTAILAADVCGYSRLMGQDEEGTLAALKTLRREVSDPKIKEHRGRIVKTTGDGLLVEFASVVDAVRCAVEVQHEMAQRNADVPATQRIEFRIGINLGDIIKDRRDIYGDGVNVAARLESLADPGGICVSRVVRDQVRDKLDFAFEDLGEQQVKNIARPVRIHRVRIEAAPDLISKPAQAAMPLPLPDRPSIAVLPFANMSGDADQEYFADGIVEEIITALSRIKWLFVIARNSTFTYKGKAVDVKQVAHELGVRYVLEGSVRKAGSRVRITGQLIDALSSGHLWADRFDGGLDDIFDLQDRVTASIVGAIAPKLEQAEIERAKRKPTENLDAYDYFLRGRAAFYQWTREANDDAQRLFYRAIDLDPEFASAYGMAGWCYVWRKTNRWLTDQQQEVPEAGRLARRAIDLGADDAIALCTGGYVLAWILHDLEGGAAVIDRALAIDPNLAWAWTNSGWTRAFLGEPDRAVEHFERALRLSPLDPQIFRAYLGTGFAHILADRYDDGLVWSERALQQRPNYLTAMRDIAVAHALSGRMPEAQRAIAQLRQADPALRIASLADWFPLRRGEDRAKYEEGLRKAGLPE